MLQGLFVTTNIEESTPLLLVTGKLFLRSEFAKQHEQRLEDTFLPFVTYVDYNESSFVIDASVKGNISRYARRSCDPSATIDLYQADGCLVFALTAARMLPKGSEVTVPFDVDWEDITYLADCACGANTCQVTKMMKKRLRAVSTPASRKGRRGSGGNTTANAASLSTQQPAATTPTAGISGSKAGCTPVAGVLTSGNIASSPLAAGKGSSLLDSTNSTPRLSREERKLMMSLKRIDEAC
eukprot:gene7930-10023_t